MISIEIYLWGLLVHALGFYAHQQIEQPALEASERVGRFLHLIFWPVISPAMLVYALLKEWG